ncbi:MAG: transcriptional regulator NrdR [Victivallaceae bacterium]|nr:transcriptional regulator NrdR [Victivallaceae bacterium]MDD4181652.1 transcriptional regulator NrdR [Victivallaceae bacterium]
MRCPKCQFQDDKVIDSRAVKDGSGVRRRRECLNCGHRFSTYEGIIYSELKVIKKDGIIEDFDRDKLRRGIENACYKRPVLSEAIDRAVDEITIAIQRGYDREIPSSELGRLVMEALLKLDKVAYVRFASVYRDFQAVDSFREIIQEIDSAEKS